MRRVVTGLDAKGAPAILFDGSPPVEVDDRLMRVAELWATDETPALVEGSADAAAREWRFEPERGGTILRAVTFLPGASTGVHATATLDYLVVVSGEVVLVVGEDEVTLKAGEVVVQNATMHEWVNRSDAPCVMVGVLISARRPADAPPG